MELAFPPVSVAQELLHVLCKADDAKEFLATAHAWLVLVDRANSFGSPDEALAAVQAEHDDALARTVDIMWREHLLMLLEETLFATPRYRDYWEQVRPQLETLHSRLH